MGSRSLTLASAAALLAASGGCWAQTKPAAPPPAPSPQGLRGEVLSKEPASPEAIAELRRLLFADRPPDVVVRELEAKGSDASVEPWRSFARAAEETKRGRPAEAKKALRGVLSMPDVETRILLLAWKGLRELGERPPPGVAAEVRGVVCELHNEAGVGTLAAYADGSVRWFGGQGKASFWEAPGADAEMDASIRELLESAAPLVKRVPAAEQRRPDELKFEHYRVSVLTFGGIHVVDIYGPEVDNPGHFLTRTFAASIRLLDVLTELEERQK